MELDVEAATSRAASGGEEGELFSLPLGKKRGDLTRLKIGRDHVCPSFFGHLLGSVNNIFEIAKHRTNFELSKKKSCKKNLFNFSKSFKLSNFTATQRARYGAEGPRRPKRKHRPKKRRKCQGGLQDLEKNKKSS